VKRYLARRLLLAVPVLIGVSIVVFMVLHLSPGDPAEIMLGSAATKEDLARLRADLGLTEPLPVQYVRWMSHVVRGDLGRSLWMRRAVLPDVLERFRATLVLTGTALLLSRSACCRRRARTRGSIGSAPSPRCSAPACRCSGSGSCSW
jgi:peptide/nickel transport system permease protein